MTDVLPNYNLEQQRLRSQIAAQRAQIEQQWLAILEMADRKQRHEDNIAAAKRSIADFEERLRDLEETHGILTDEQREQMKESVSIGESE